MSRRRYLLLQTRNSADAMRRQEVDCFVRKLDCNAADIEIVDLLTRGPTQPELDRVDVVLLGGSGHYSAAGKPSELGRPRPRPRSDWLERALDVMRQLHDQSKPTFASCWGFQAMARAMGGSVIHDPRHAEVGTHALRLTPEGRKDPVFGPMGEVFHGQMGHEDHVDRLPEGTTLLASSESVANQAYRFDGLPIYCTQFHPELNEQDLLERVTVYPEYIERIAGLSPENFDEIIHPTPETEQLLLRFVEHVFG